jgi:hypothetical protein
MTRTTHLLISINSHHIYAIDPQLQTYTRKHKSLRVPSEISDKTQSTEANQIVLTCRMQSVLKATTLGMESINAPTHGPAANITNCKAHTSLINSIHSLTTVVPFFNRKS